MKISELHFVVLCFIFKSADIQQYMAMGVANMLYFRHISRVFLGGVIAVGRVVAYRTAVLVVRRRHSIADRASRRKFDTAF